MPARLFPGCLPQIVLLTGVSMSLFLAGREAAGGEAAGGTTAVGTPQSRTVIAYRPRLFGRRFYSGPVQTSVPEAAAPTPAKPAEVWKPLFDGKTLTGWKSTKFGGQGEITVENGSILLDMGSPLTGITLVDG